MIKDSDVSDYSDDLLAEAEGIALKYALNQVLEPPEGHGNLLTAALKCGCRSCVGAYIAMINWITMGDKKMTDAIVISNGVRYK